MTVYDADLGRPMGSWRKTWLEACKRAGVRHRWHDLRHSFVTRLAERPEVSEQTIRALAGHVSNQMLQHYSHIRSQAKQAAIRAIEEQATSPNLPEQGQRTGQCGEQAGGAAQPNSPETKGGPARIRTWDRRIMSVGIGSLLPCLNCFRVRPTRPRESLPALFCPCRQLSLIVSSRDSVVSLD